MGGADEEDDIMQKLANVLFWFAAKAKRLQLRSVQGAVL